jgi:hypothetical protein
MFLFWGGGRSFSNFLKFSISVDVLQVYVVGADNLVCPLLSALFVLTFCGRHAGRVLIYCSLLVSFSVLAFCL